MSDADIPTLMFPLGWDERAACEMEWKGWVWAAVRLANGSIIEVSFYDPVRLSQDLASEQESGNVCIADPGLIVVPSVTVQYMREAVRQLQRSGYFERFVPLNENDAQRFGPWDDRAS